MPPSTQILQTLAELAQQERPLAIVWHGYVLALCAAVLFGWRPRRRLAASLILLPVASVVVMALLTANWFTGVLLAGYLAAAGTIIARMPAMSIQIASRWRVCAAVAVLLFGLSYPHFLGPTVPLQYLYAAPLGIVPCPTLAAAIGASLAVESFGSPAWSLLLIVVGGFYGAFGALRLGVTLDWSLIAAVLLLLATLISTPEGWRRAASTVGTGRPA